MFKLEWTEHHQGHPMVSHLPCCVNERVHLGCFYRLKLPINLGTEKEKKRHSGLLYIVQGLPKRSWDHLEIFLLLLIWAVSEHFDESFIETVLLARNTFPRYMFSTWEADIFHRIQYLVSRSTLLCSRVKVTATRQGTF